MNTVKHVYNDKQDSINFALRRTFLPQVLDHVSKAIFPQCLKLMINCKGVSTSGFKPGILSAAVNNVNIPA